MLKDQEGFTTSDLGRKGAAVLCEKIGEGFFEEVILKKRHRKASHTNS